MLAGLCHDIAPPAGNRERDARLLAQVGPEEVAPRVSVMQRSATDPTAPNWTHLRSVETLFTVRMLLLAAFKDLSTCRAQRGRSCERGAAGGGDFSLDPWAFHLGKKICHSNVTTAETMHEAFVRSEEAFMANSTPKVTHPPLLDFGWPEDQVSDHARPHPVPLAPVSPPRGHASSGKSGHRASGFIAKAACRGLTHIQDQCMRMACAHTPST